MSGEINWVNSDLQVKNMVSKSCIYLVRQVASNFDEVKVNKVSLGKLSISYPARKFSPEKLEKALQNFGFTVLKDPDEQMVEQIKIAAIELIHYANNANSLIRNSDYLSERLSQPYQKLSKVFSEKTSTTLEKYLILLKIEKVKELVLNGEHSLSEIAYMMGYSSVQYLSNQFKQVTNQSVSAFKKSDDPHRTALEDLI